MAEQPQTADSRADAVAMAAGSKPKGKRPYRRPGPDRRLRSARRFKAVLASLYAELGQQPQAMPETMRAMATTAAGLIVANEQMASRIASGEAVDADKLVRLSGSLQRALEALQLVGEGLAARQEQQRQAALAAERAALGLPPIMRPRP